jgi:tetratricopeptide (TPR) repeat protein
MNEESLFAAALEKESTAERQAFLEQACAGDDGLRRRVERLLAGHRRADGILDRAAVPEAGRPEPLAADRVFADRFELRRKLGEGGMGEVWVADQIHPVRRRVALKVVRPGLDSARLLARFDHERQALALMDHPNIAKVLDAGATPDGRPYFVMELIEGVPITQFCDEGGLSLRERLELVIAVCHAVQHAHQKGIVHRDLKPSNVLVGRCDGRSVPKVIDFGVAKAVGLGPTDHTAHTEVGSLVGTLEYMSPEQAEPNNPDIDTRSDVYSLGVVLYELLTGGVPFPRAELWSVPFTEMLRTIREVEPPKPSVRLRQGRAAGRGLGPAFSVRQFRELDWIVARCLEKDRARRYETADGLAQDLRRYLADEPVLAGPPSAGYRLRKFVRRNRGPVLAAAVFVLLLVGGIAGTTAGLVEARRQEGLAVAARAEEAEARRRESDRAEAEAGERRRAAAAEAEARKQQREATDRLDIAYEVTEFLLKDLLHQAGSTAQAERRFAPKPDLTVREALDRAAAAAGDRFAGRPVLEAAVRRALGDAYGEVGQYEKAIAQLDLCARLWARHRGPENPSTLAALTNLATYYREAGRTAEAIEVYERVRAAQTTQRNPDQQHALITLNNLAAAYRDVGKRAEAAALFEQVRDAEVRTLGPDHPTTLMTLNNLATIYLDAGKVAEAAALFEQVRRAREKAPGPDHPTTLITLNNLAAAYWWMGRLDKSIPLFEHTLAVQRRVLGDQHPDTLRTAANLGVNYRDAGQLAEAIPLLEQAHRGGRRYAFVAWVGGELLATYERAGRVAEATALARDNLAAARKALPAGSPKLVAAVAAAGTALLRLGAWADAEAALREWLAAREATEPDDWGAFAARSMLGAALLGQRKYAEAEPLLLAGYGGMMQRERTIPPQGKGRLPEAAEGLVELYTATSKPDEAKKWWAERAKYPFVAPPPRPVVR